MRARRLGVLDRLLPAHHALPLEVELVARNRDDNVAAHLRARINEAVGGRRKGGAQQGGRAGRGGGRWQGGARRTILRSSLARALRESICRSTLSTIITCGGWAFSRLRERRMESRRISRACRLNSMVKEQE